MPVSTAQGAALAAIKRPGAGQPGAVLLRAEDRSNATFSTFTIPDDFGTAISATGSGSINFEIANGVLRGDQSAGSLYLYRNIGVRPKSVRAEIFAPASAGAFSVMLGCSSNDVFAAANNQIHPFFTRSTYAVTIYEGGVSRTLKGTTAYPNGYTVPDGAVVQLGWTLIDGGILLELPGGGHDVILDKAIPRYTGPTVVWQLASAGGLGFVSLRAERDTRQIDTGWRPLTLNTGLSAVAGWVAPRIRRIGDMVFIEGICQNTSGGTLAANGNVIPTALSVEFRPPNSVGYLVLAGSVYMAPSGVLRHPQSAAASAYVHTILTYSVTPE